jgi:cytoskeletal protein RodZ
MKLKLSTKNVPKPRDKWELLAWVAILAIIVSLIGLTWSGMGQPLNRAKVNLVPILTPTPSPTETPTPVPTSVKKTTATPAPTATPTATPKATAKP